MNKIKINKNIVKIKAITKVSEIIINRKYPATNGMDTAKSRDVYKPAFNLLAKLSFETYSPRTLFWIYCSVIYDHINKYSDCYKLFGVSTSLGENEMFGFKFLKYNGIEYSQFDYLEYKNYGVKLLPGVWE